MDKINYKNLFKTKYKKERIKFLFLSFGMLFVSVFIIMKLSDTYAKFASEVKLKSNIDKAIYLINSTKLTFDIDPDRIVPSDKPYQYKFSVSNFSDNKISDIDIDYDITLVSTTNLPINIKLIRNENYSSSSTNIFNNPIVRKDLGDVFYKEYKTKNKYSFLYSAKNTDIYTLVIDFPKEYGRDTTYVSQIENIEITIKSHQKV
jgi:hypothetical protein